MICKFMSNMDKTTKNKFNNLKQKLKKRKLDL